jgi:LysR family nitrogen assimilation transcriptional regulator
VLFVLPTFTLRGISARSRHAANAAARNPRAVVCHGADIEQFLNAIACLRREPIVRNAIVVAIHEGLSDELWRLLANGELDAALYYDLGTIKSVTKLPLFQHDLFLVGLPQTLMSVGSVERTALREFSLVLGKNGTGGFVESVATADGIELRIAFDVAQKNLKRELLIHEACCTIAPYGQFLDEINSGVLSARRITPRLTPTVMLMLHKALSAKTREFVESTIRAVVKFRIEESVEQWRAINCAD